ncbi:hypothetical protein SISNIDRAFT_468498 [Sistotremastrum niveocremeum HHB9708]|uniref:F-box domain-containing protein n=1 Tax=Sistotremastrum niveocremeum HHB9708 TaxID=1314777 RepID=A0A164RBM2_9AGAM|nr:hypothetical protein SISNIDRAFT_468498 [Sistotremastrum niveocremeum HHB9708]
MTFDDLPPEVLLIIWECLVMTDEKNFLDKKASEKLRARMRTTVRFAQITHRTRAIVLECPTLWREIDLCWPTSAIEHFLTRAQNVGLSIHLDSTKGTRDPADAVVEWQTWAAFLKANMPVIQHLFLRIDSTKCSQALSSALQTPAVNLQTLTLKMDTLLALVNIFSSQAPKLRSVNFVTTRCWDLSRFHSISNVEITVGPENCKKTLATLQAMPAILSVILIGQNKPEDIPQLLPKSTILRTCRHFKLSKILPQGVRCLMLAIRLPSLEKANISERMVLYDNKLAPTTITQVLRSVPVVKLEVASLLIEIEEHSATFEVEGTLNYRYSSRWNDLGKTLPLHDARIYDTVINILTLPHRQSKVQPTHLIIRNNISTRAHATPTAMRMLDFHLLWNQIFTTYSTIEHLELVGYVKDMVETLHQVAEYLPLMAKLEVSHKDLPAPALLDALSDLERDRQLSLRVEQLPNRHALKSPITS